MQIGEPLLCVSDVTGDSNVFKVTLQHTAAIERGLELVEPRKKGVSHAGAIPQSCRRLSTCSASCSPTTAA